MVKAYNRPPLRKLGKGEAFITVSASNPMQRHITVVLEQPLVMSSGTFDVVCSCMGWTRHHHCWHADEAFANSDVFVQEEEPQGEWVPAPECEEVHPYGEDGWRPGKDGVHEHWIVPRSSDGLGTSTITVSDEYQERVNLQSGRCRHGNPRPCVICATGKEQ